VQISLQKLGVFFEQIFLGIPLPCCIMKQGGTCSAYRRGRSFQIPWSFIHLRSIL